MSMQATFSDFPCSAGRHLKGPVYALHHNRQTTSEELSAPLTLHTHFSLFFSTAFGEEGQGNVINSAF